MIPQKCIVLALIIATLFCLCVPETVLAGKVIHVDFSKKARSPEKTLIAPAPETKKCEIILLNPVLAGASLAPDSSLTSHLITFVQGPLGDYIFNQTPGGRKLAKRVGVLAPEGQPIDLGQLAEAFLKRDSRFQEQLLQRLLWIQGGSRYFNTNELDLPQVSALTGQWLEIRSILFNPITRLNQITFAKLGLGEPKQPPFSGDLPDTLPSDQTFIRVLKAAWENEVVRYLLTQTPEGKELLWRLSDGKSVRGQIPVGQALESLESPELHGLLFELDFRLAAITNAMSWVRPNVKPVIWARTLNKFAAEALTLVGNRGSLVFKPIQMHFVQPRENSATYY